MLHHLTYRLLFLLLGGLLPALAAYAQPGRFSAPVKLPEVVNSTAEEGMPYLAPDGQTLYFVRTFHPDNIGGEGSGQDVWSSTFEDGQWSAPENSFSFNDEENNAVTGISTTGDTLYLLGTYSKKAQLKKGLALTTDPEGVWKRPSPVSIPGLNIKGDFYVLFMNETADRLVISMNGKNSLGEEDLYICVKRKSGRWSRPIHLGDTVNSTGYEISPFLAEDGRTLYFASVAVGGKIERAAIFGQKR
ncbi:MAG: hypothetical protein AAGB22_09490, partial [Bacteroidota bacterium]